MHRGVLLLPAPYCCGCTAGCPALLVVTGCVAALGPWPRASLTSWEAHPGEQITRPTLSRSCSEAGPTCQLAGHGENYFLFFKLEELISISIKCINERLLYRVRALRHCPAASAREPAGFAEPFLETRLSAGHAASACAEPRQSHRRSDRCTFAFAKRSGEFSSFLSCSFPAAEALCRA